MPLFLVHVVPHYLCWLNSCLVVANEIAKCFKVQLENKQKNLKIGTINQKMSEITSSQ